MLSSNIRLVCGYRMVQSWVIWFHLPFDCSTQDWFPSMPPANLQVFHDDIHHRFVRHSPPASNPYPFFSLCVLLYYFRIFFLSFISSTNDHIVSRLRLVFLTHKTRYLLHENIEIHKLNGVARTLHTKGINNDFYSSGGRSINKERMNTSYLDSKKTILQIREGW